jgi:TolB-like protein
MKISFRLFACTILLVFSFNIINVFAQPRVAVFPFQNMDGKMELNIWSFKLQDSLTKAMEAINNKGQFFNIVPNDSVEQLLTELNIDPMNPQYPSDMWKVAKILNVQKIITGNFNIQAERFLINAYVYDVRTRLANPKNQAKDIFKAEANIFESIPEIVKELIPVFMRN